MQYTCQACGASFNSDPSRKRKYCSARCFGTTNTRSQERLGAEDVNVRRIVTRMQSPKLGHKTEMVCDGCGITFSEYPKRRPRPLKFCTRDCGIAYQRAHGKGHVGNMDLDSAAPRRPAGPNMTVVVDRQKGELRNQ